MILGSLRMTGWRQNAAGIPGRAVDSCRSNRHETQPVALIAVVLPGAGVLAALLAALPGAEAGPAALPGAGPQAGFRLPRNGYRLGCHAVFGPMPYWQEQKTMLVLPW